jgi:dUTP pyrophosphatase
MKINIKILRESKSGIPFYATPGSVGMDLVASIEETIEITPGQRKLIPTGFSMSLPQGYEAQIRPRSGLALKKGITVLNTPGTIDSDYRGEIGVILINTDQNQVFVVSPGDKIAQMVINKVEIIEWDVVDDLDATQRNSGGFGSTGS